MRRKAAILVAVVIGLAAGVVRAEPAAIAIGYLEVAGDPRYEKRRAYTGLRLRTRNRPYDGARLAIRDSRFVGSALNVAFALERAEGKSAAELVAIVRRLRAEKGVRFFIVDGAADVLSEVAAATGGDNVLLFNISEAANALRGEKCAANLMHVLPSRAMRMDGLVQYLVSKNWRDILVLKGPSPDDDAMALSFQNSAKKFGAKIVGVKDFELSNDPRHRDRNNIALLTAAPRHDVVFLADTDGEFGRYVPFQTSHPRPVVGSEGLVAAGWHWTWERHGAPQLNQRFEKRAKRTMQSADWAAWAAVKAIVEAVVRSKSTEFAQVTAYLKSARLTLDVYKGTPASFRPWNNQLRQPVILHTHNAVVARAPIQGFLHSTDDLDTIGSDAPENRCKF